MGVKRFLNKSFFFWVFLFALGTAAGALLYKTLLPHAVPLLKLGAKTAGEINSSGGVKAAAFIFLKNALVVVLCVLLGRFTRGVFPAAVCFLNGGVLGFLGAVLANYGHVAWWRYAVALLPHGVVELPAVFLACAIGVAALNGREKLSLMKYPLAMLVAAACIEVWVSSAIANRII